MNGDDKLRDRLGRVDPAGHAVPVRSIDDPASRQQLEQIMTTAPTIPTRTNGRRRFALMAAAAAVVVVAVGAFVALRGGDDEPDVAAVQLTAGPSNTLASCLALDAGFLAEMPLAFKGTVDAIDGTTVTLDVDEWYTGGDSDTVLIDAPEGLEALIGDVDFVVGETYLVSATDGVVNYCGFSGPATPELQAVYDAAFPG